MILISIVSIGFPCDNWGNKKTMIVNTPLLFKEISSAVSFCFSRTCF